MTKVLVLYYSSYGHIERMAGLAPETLACMHGSAWRGDGRSLLLALADSLEAVPSSAAR